MRPRMAMDREVGRLPFEQMAELFLDEGVAADQPIVSADSIAKDTTLSWHEKYVLLSFSSSLQFHYSQLCS